jgi:NAD(P)-dependent dehydrogenase (short-subunit alcohol dehydrogenase family)
MFKKGFALIAGGSGVIGSAIARRLASEGCKVVLTYRSGEAKARQLADEIEAAGGKAEIGSLDLQDAAAVAAFAAAAVERNGPMSAAVYAAGPAIKFQLINQIAPEEWARVINGDANAAFNLVSAVLPHMREQQFGALLGVLTAAVDRSPPRDILSAAPKAAIQMLFKSVALEEGRNGIRANCVAPGYILDGIGTSMIGEHDAGFAERMIKAIPMKRTGQAAEVAEVAAFLMSDRAAYVTGSTIHVAGGLQLA